MLFLPPTFLSAITMTNISLQSFTFKMAAKINWHRIRYGTIITSLSPCVFKKERFLHAMWNYFIDLMNVMFCLLGSSKSALCYIYVPNRQQNSNVYRLAVAVWYLAIHHAT